VLALIARRTGQPISYFMAQPSDVPQPDPDLADDLARLANRARTLGRATQLRTVEREAMKLIELTLRQAAVLTKSIETHGVKGSKRS